MTAKEYLLQAYLLEQRIESKLMQVEMLRNLATRSTSICSPGTGGRIRPGGMRSCGCCRKEG